MKPEPHKNLDFSAPSGEHLETLLKAAAAEATIGDTVQVSDTLTLSAHIGEHEADVGFEVKF